MLLFQHFLNGVNMLNNPIRLCGNDVSAEFRQTRRCAHFIPDPTETRQRKEELVPSKGKARDTLLPVNEKVSIELNSKEG